MSLVMRIYFLYCVFILSGCVAGPYGGGLVFVNPFSAISDMQTAPEMEKQQAEVYGPPQIIYRIDKDRYFTLEEYTRCENGKTFYNNKEKGIHVQIASSSGYLFKGRLFWLSTRDDYLAFPVTANDNKSVCMGSDKGCLNAISVTTDGGKTVRPVTYGSNTDDPNEDTKNYDMLVTDKEFYLIEFSDDERIAEDGYVLKWTFSPATVLAHPAYPGVTGPEYQKGLPIDDISKVKQVRMQCNRELVPEQQSGEDGK